MPPSMMQKLPSARRMMNHIFDIHAANRRMGVRIDDLYFGVPQYTIPVSQRFSSILASKWVIRRAPLP